VDAGQCRVCTDEAALEVSLKNPLHSVLVDGSVFLFRLVNSRFETFSYCNVSHVDCNAPYIPFLIKDWIEAVLEDTLAKGALKTNSFLCIYDSLHFFFSIFNPIFRHKVKD